MKYKFISVVGARPQFVKAAIVSREMMKSYRFHELILHTGQHYDSHMSQVFFDQLKIPHPQWNLSVGSASHASQTARMMEGIESILSDERPRFVLVYGDTNSTLAASLTAAKLNIPVVHIEAGLRSRNKNMPEEINRILTDHCSDLLLCPTKLSLENLLNEGFDRSNSYIVGDVMYDAALYYGRESSSLSRSHNSFFKVNSRYILLTVHRQENTDNADKLHMIFECIISLSKELPVVWPVHPRLKEAANNHLGGISNVHLLDPVGYTDMLGLIKNSSLVATDSGGLQKEAYFLSVPCVTLRHETEWPELLDMGWNFLCPPDLGPATFRDQVLGRLGKVGSVGNKPYGDGNAVKLVRQMLEDRY